MKKILLMLIMMLVTISVSVSETFYEYGNTGPVPHQILEKGIPHDMKLYQDDGYVVERKITKDLVKDAKKNGWAVRFVVDDETDDVMEFQFVAVDTVGIVDGYTAKWPNETK